MTDARGPAAARAFLLPETVDHARAQSPFWRDRIGAGDALERFASLAPLTKSTAIAAGHALYASGYDEALDQRVISSGTQREGRGMLCIRRQPAEQRAFARFRATLRTLRKGPAPRTPTVCELWNVTHGLPAGSPPAGTFRAPWFPCEAFIDLALGSLEDAVRHGGGRIDAVRGSVTALRTLASVARARGIDLEQYGVIALGSNSYEATSRVRRALLDAFAAKTFVDSYSLSEFTTPAPDGPEPFVHTFTVPPLLPEVLTAGGEVEPFADGVRGRLLLTGLVPFVQRTPLLRYDTGDLIEVGSFQPKHGDHGFRVLGRAADAVYAEVCGSPRLVIAPTDVFRVADAEPEVARVEHPVETLGVVPRQGLGAPKAAARRRENAVRVEFVLRAGATGPGRRSVIEALREGLLERNADLEVYVAEGGHFEVVAVPSGALPDDRFKF